MSPRRVRRSTPLLIGAGAVALLCAIAWTIVSALWIGELGADARFFPDAFTSGPEQIAFLGAEQFERLQLLRRLRIGTAGAAGAAAVIALAAAAVRVRPRR